MSTHRSMGGYRAILVGAACGGVFLLLGLSLWIESARAAGEPQTIPASFEAGTLPPAAQAVTPSSPAFPTLEDFWNGRAVWVLDVPDTGLPIGESDTLYMGNGVFWSYLHASTESAGVVDSCGGPVAFPGCVTRWVSTDGGQHFDISERQCLLGCNTCPCKESDLTRQQQYPRVARSASGSFYMVFEHDAATWMTTSLDGLKWTRPVVNPKTGAWKLSDGYCEPSMRIWPHPFTATPYKCLAGAPPGIFISGNRLYEFVGLGQNPGHMGCFRSWLSDPYYLVPCTANPLFSGATDYGPLNKSGRDADPYFDYRYVSAADVVRVGDYYYMSYEGVRGPSSWDVAGDNQFALGFARSNTLNGPWERYRYNPVLGDVANNVGVGHADIVIADGVTFMYTATPALTRGRYVLMFK